MKKINSKGMMQGAIALSIAAFIAKIFKRGVPSSFPKYGGQHRFLCISAGVSYLWNRHDLCVNGIPGIRVQCSRRILGVDTFKEIIEAVIRDCEPYWSGDFCLPPFGCGNDCPLDGRR